MLVLAADGDIADIVALVNRAYRGADGSGWSSESEYLRGDRLSDDQLRQDLQAKPDARLLKWEAQTGPDLLACVWLEPLPDDVWYLGILAVDPAQQNGGFGRHVLTAAEHWVADHGGVRVRMSVINVRERLIAWYQRRGYERTGETEPFPYEDDRFGVPTRDDLQFVILEKDVKNPPSTGSS